MLSNDGWTLAEAGMARAAEHADRVSDGWQDRAYEFLKLYALRNRSFTAEEVRAAAVGLVPDPPDGRAWGAVMRRASRACLISREGFESAKDARVHRNIVTRWRVNHYWGP